MQTHRAMRALEQVEHDFPTAWMMYDHFLSNRKALGGWPPYVFAPLAAAEAIVSGGGPLDPSLREDVARLGALAAWRTTQGIYRFAPALLEALWETSVPGNVAAEVLRGLPEWCVYLEIERDVGGCTLHGVWAHLERDPTSRVEELRLLLDFEPRAVAVSLMLVGTLEQSMVALCASWLVGARPAGAADQRAQAVIEPVVSALLYLCASNAELCSSRGERARPRPQLRRAGEIRWVAAEEPTTWEVGTRHGAELEPPAPVVNTQWYVVWVEACGSAERRCELRWSPAAPARLEDARGSRG